MYRLRISLATLMKIIKQHAHKHAAILLAASHADMLQELETTIGSVSAAQALSKETQEKSKLSKWGGLLFDPKALNRQFKSILYPNGWAKQSAITGQYQEPTLTFSHEDRLRASNRVRKMDGIKRRVGLEIQFGKYAFMGYDIFVKMIIFRNHDLIDYGIEIVLMQSMVDRMSTGISAFEHLMIDFEHRGTADIDVPVLVLGIGPTDEEWAEVETIQALYRQNRAAAVEQYPFIESAWKHKGSPPGPK